MKLVPVKREDKAILANLYQFYNYDFSPFTKQDLNENGKFEADIEYFWEGDHRWNPYFIEVSGHIAGFVVVLLENLDTDPDPTHVIYDFMILQKYRRNRLGTAAAIKVFDLFKANWKLAQMNNNAPAIAFWRKVLAEYTKNNFIENFRGGKYVQRFSTKSESL